MSSTHHLVTFNLDEERFAIHLTAVERVVRAVEITPLPQAPSVVLGIINVHGQVMPVLNVRLRCQLPDKEIGIEDYFVIAATSKRRVAFVVDSVTGVVEYKDTDLACAKDITPGISYIEGVLKLPDGMLLIHNLDEFFALDEEKSLDLAMNAL